MKNIWEWYREFSFAPKNFYDKKCKAVTHGCSNRMEEFMLEDHRAITDELASRLSSRNKLFWRMSWNTKSICQMGAKNVHCKTLRTAIFVPKNFCAVLEWKGKNFWIQLFLETKPRFIISHKKRKSSQNNGRFRNRQNSKNVNKWYQLVRLWRPSFGTGKGYC